MTCLAACSCGTNIADAHRVPGNGFSRPRLLPTFPSDVFSTCCLLFPMRYSILTSNDCGLRNLIRKRRPANAVGVIVADRNGDGVEQHVEALVEHGGRAALSPEKAQISSPRLCPKPHAMPPRFPRDTGDMTASMLIEC
jgi:hypothetical protein